MDKPGKVATPARGQLNREKIHVSLFLLARGNLVSRDRFGRPVPRQSACSYSALSESGAYSSWEFYTAIRHRVSPEFIGSPNCVPMAFTAESPPAQGQ